MFWFANVFCLFLHQYFSFNSANTLPVHYHCVLSNDNYTLSCFYSSVGQRVFECAVLYPEDCVLMLGHRDEAS